MKVDEQEELLEKLLAAKDLITGLKQENEELKEEQVKITNKLNVINTTYIISSKKAFDFEE